VLSISEFGTYDSVEHIDNPAGLRGSDVFGQVPGAAAAQTSADSTQAGAAALASPSNPDVGRAATLAGTAGPENQGYAITDPRYAATPINSSAVMNPQDVPAFQVDESALPRYMTTSREWLKGTLHQSAAIGRHREEGRGPRLLQAASIRCRISMHTRISAKSP
jgi:hypothetical protein